MGGRLLVVMAALVALGGAARADDAAAAPVPARIVAAEASSTEGSEATTGVARLFDGDDGTTWCAREKVKARITLRLAGVTRLSTLELGLGHPTQWKAGPRIKQVVVSVIGEGRLLKKVRHKWPDGEPRAGRVNLQVSGDTVVVDVDQVYAGSGPRGLCLAGLRLSGGYDGGEAPVDAAALAARALGADAARAALARDFEVVVPVGEGEHRHRLRLTRQGKLVYEDTTTGLVVTGTWKLDGEELVVTLARAKRGKAAITVPPALATLRGAWRFAEPADGQPPTFLPWLALTVGDDGALAPAPPRAVLPAAPARPTK
jgi:hypothetical protein